MDSPKRDRSCREKEYFDCCEKPAGVLGSLGRSSARPGEGEPKGEKLAYDPDKEKIRNKKDKRATKPIYVSFGQKVNFHLSGQTNTLAYYKTVNIDQSKL